MFVPDGRSTSPWFSQGNVRFITTGEAMEIENAELVSWLAELTSTEPQSLLNTLLYRTVAAGGGEVIQKDHSTDEANYARDACAKVTVGLGWGNAWLLVICVRCLGLLSRTGACKFC